MSAEFWTTAENFYETILPVLGILCAFLLLVIFYIRMYAKGQKKKWMTLGTLGMMLLSVTYGTWGYVRYQAYLPKAKIVTPLIRDRKRGIFGNQYFNRQQLDLYLGYNDTENLRKLSFYDEVEVETEITFLGEGSYFYYFEEMNGNIFKYKRNTVFVPNQTTTKVIGHQFHLNDPSFESIGFFEPGRTMYDRIEIPEEEKGKVYEPENDFIIPQADEHLLRWNF